ncbi:MAG TPA: MFS transporter [Candidatus Eremiobacteraceae bacterium]
MSQRSAGFASGLLARTFAALRHRNYRLYFIGMVISLTGGWMQIVAAGWLVLRVTSSPLLLGVITAMETLPALFFSLLAGALADRIDKRRFAMITQSLLALQALGLGLLVRTHTASFWPIFWLALFAGVVSSFDVPVRQSLLFDLVGPEDIINATALNSVIFNVARIVGPTIAALIIVRSGEAVNFFANALSFVFVVWALWSIRIGPGAAAARAARRSEPLRRQIAYGVGYAFAHPLLARMFAALFVFSVFGFNYILLMPVFAKYVLHGGAHALGILMTCLGVGALLGSLSMAGRARTSLRSLVVTGLLFPASLVVFALTHTLVAASIAVGALGLCMVQFAVRFSSLLQMESGADVRGRVLGLYNTVLVGLAPLGALQAGALAQAYGAGIALAGGAVVCSAAVIVAVVWPRDQPIRVSSPASGERLLAEKTTVDVP